MIKAKFQNLQDLNSKTFQGFSSTVFKHLICFQALSRALKFLFQIQAFSRISQARYEPCTDVSLWVTQKLGSHGDSPSFAPGLKTSSSAIPSYCSLLPQDWLHGFPGLFTDTSEHVHFYFQFLLYSPTFLVLASEQHAKLTYVSFQAHVKLVHHVSYRIACFCMTRCWDLAPDWSSSVQWCLV